MVYPATERPKVTIEKKVFEIIDVSEGGLKIYAKNPTASFFVGKTLEGTIAFKDKSQSVFKGKVLRIHEDFIVVRTSQGVPLQKIMSEQRYLLSKYGTL